jgi:hypothetical protein
MLAHGPHATLTFSGNDPGVLTGIDPLKLSELKSQGRAPQPAHLSRADLYQANLGRPTSPGANLSGAYLKQVAGTSTVERAPHDLFFLLYDLI